MLLSIAVLNIYFYTIIDASEYKLRKIISVEKTFSDILLKEIPSSKDPSEYEALINRYAKLRRNFVDFLSDTEDDLLLSRQNYLEDKFFINREALWLNNIVYKSLTELIDSVRYINEHHIVYLKNLMRRGSMKQDYYSDEGFQRSSEKSTSEIDIISASASIQTSLFDIFTIFNETEKDRNLLGIKEEFIKRMKRLYLFINAFESYSLDAQDGILVEELLITSRQFEKTFSNLLTIEQKKRDLLNQLDEKRDKLSKLFKLKSDKIKISNTRIKRTIGILQFISFILTLFMVSLIIFFGKKIMNEASRTVAETKRIQRDISYKIRIDESTSDEFQIVFNTLNSMTRLFLSSCLKSWI
ncbi:MAG: hypothetical protein ISS59_05950 [Desulfobacteraceae bacterium]|nr:hypothetical protein [Desulfobacteraceae bacterium]